MSQLHPDAAAPASAAFNLPAVVAAAGGFADTDHAGLTHVRASWFGLTFAPSGPTASCRLALLTGGGMAYRDLVLDTDGAIALAALACRYADAQLVATGLADTDDDDDDDPAIDAVELERHAALMLEHPFEDAARTWSLSQRLGLHGSNGAAREPHDEVLHPHVLAHVLPFANVHAGTFITEVRGPFDRLFFERSPREGRHGAMLWSAGDHFDVRFRRPAASIMALAAIQGATCTLDDGGRLPSAVVDRERRSSTPRLHRESSPLVLQRLHRLRDDVIRGLDTIEAFERLNRLFATDAQLRPDDTMSLTRMASLSSLAAGMWWARLEGDRQPGSSLAEVIASFAPAARVGDDECRWRFRSGHLELRLLGDLAIGHGGVVLDGELRHAATVALSPPRLGAVLAAFAAADLAGGPTARPHAELAADLLLAPLTSLDAAWLALRDAIAAGADRRPGQA